MRSFETPVNCEIWLDSGDCVLAHWLHAPCHGSRECLFHRVVKFKQSSFVLMMLLL